MPKLLVIEMEDQYPFGCSKENTNESTTILIRQTKQYHNSTEYQKLKKKAIVLKAIKHPHLVNLDHYLQQDGSLHYFYQYVPLQLDKWISVVNHGLFENIKNDIHRLIDYLEAANVKFQFNPQSIGLGSEMQAKYFLDNFQYDSTGNHQHYISVKDSVEYYFKVFQEFTTVKKQIESNQSIQKLQINKYISKSNNQDTKSFEEKVEQSKKKSLEALKRFKKTHLGS